MPQLPDNGIVHLSSPHTVLETLARLEAVVQAKGIAILAMIDHSGEAAKAGIQMEPTGSSSSATRRPQLPIMLASPSAAIDLPLKALVWQDKSGKVWLSYNSPAYLKQRHDIPDNLLPNIAGIEAICAQAVR